jgi:hypothetical protein
MEHLENFSVTIVTKKETLTNQEEEDSEVETDLEEEEDCNSQNLNKKSRAIEIFCFAKLILIPTAPSPPDT